MRLTIIKEWYISKIIPFDLCIALYYNTYDHISLG